MTGHIAMIGDPETGKTYKLGKEAEYIHNKYRDTKKRIQKIKNREKRIEKDVNHKVSIKIVKVMKFVNHLNKPL